MMRRNAIIVAVVSAALALLLLLPADAQPRVRVGIAVSTVAVGDSATVTLWWNAVEHPQHPIAHYGWRLVTGDPATSDATVLASGETTATRVTVRILLPPPGDSILIVGGVYAVNDRGRQGQTGWTPPMYVVTPDPGPPAPVPHLIPPVQPDSVVVTDIYGNRGPFLLDAIDAQNDLCAVVYWPDGRATNSCNEGMLEPTLRRVL
jgi:hypothetical protein